MNVTISVFARFHAFYLARELSQRKYLMRLITTYPKFEVVKYGIPRTCISSLLRYEVLLRSWSKLPFWLRPDIDVTPWFHEQFDSTASRHIPIETNIYVGWSGFSEQGLAVAKKHGAVTILERGAAHIEYQRDILEEEYDLHGGKPHLPHIRLIEKECREYAIADYISVPSLFVRQTFVDRGVPSDKLLVNPYGVDLGQFHQQPKLDNVFRVIFVGAMSLQKGVHYLLQAFYELQLPRAELWLVGAKQPEIEPFFTKYAGSFRYLGSVPQGELYRLYSQCSVFVICSIQDGFGMVVSQAMSCGLPIICTFNTGSRDLIHEGREGFIVPIRDVEALKEKLGYLYANQELGIEMGQAAKRRVGFGLTWTDYGNRAAAMYERLLLCHI